MYEIYVAINTIDWKVYVGQSGYGLEYRWSRHIKSMNNGCEYYIHRAMRKHGVENFSVSLVEIVETREEANESETRWIKHYRSNNPEFGYNMTLGGEGRLLHDLPIEEIKQLYASNMNALKIGERCGVGEGVILDRLDVAGVQIRPNTYRRRQDKLEKLGKTHLINLDLPEIKRLYEKEELTTFQIAYKYETSPGYIFVLLDKMGVAIRGNRKPEGPEQKCCECLQVKLLEDFHVNNAVSNGRMSRCKTCCLDYAKKRYEETQAKESKERFENRKNRTERVCNKCGILKPLADFHKSKNLPDGYTYTCKSCRTELRRVIDPVPSPSAE